MVTDLTHKNSRECFNVAIAHGQLSTNPKSVRYAGHFMYMHSIRTIDWFKRIDSRKYLAADRAEPWTGIIFIS